MPLKLAPVLVLVLSGVVVLEAAAQTTEAESNSADSVPAAETPDAEPLAQTPSSESPSSELRIRAAIASYVKAFNARDVKTLVAHWSPQGVYVSASTGEQVVGREAIESQFESMLEGDGGPNLAVTTESIELISPSVALERGKAIVTRGEDDVTQTDYRVIYVERDGKWLIDRVTEDEPDVTDTRYERLKDLEWMIGEWNDIGEGFVIDVDCQWTEKQNFIRKLYSVSNQDGVESSGLQIIGWDASTKQIRSWLFDSEGGTVDGTWSHRDDRWVVQSVATLADGSKGSFTSVFRPLEDGNFAWQKINRVLDGKLLPNIPEVIVQRK